MAADKNDTFEMLYSMKNKMDRFFSISDQDAAGGLTGRNQWSPAVDLFDSGPEYCLVMEVPGVEKDQLELSAYKDKVVIKGWRGESSVVPPRAEVLCLERVGGHFERVILLPDEIDSEQVKASLQSGVLTVFLSKKNCASVKKKITID